MEVWIAEQWKTIGESCIMGLIFGAGYDIIRVLQVLCGIRSKKTPIPSCPKDAPFWLYVACDLVYMLSLTIASSIFLGQVNHGILRWYLVLPCVAGLWLYRNTIGRLVMTLSEIIATGLRLLLRQLIVRPMRWVGSILLRIGKTVVCGIAYGVKRALCYLRMRHRMRHFDKLVKL